MKSIKTISTLSAALFISALLVALPGCDSQEGPMEKAGKSVDNAVEKTGEQMEKAGEAIQDTAQGDNK